LGDGGFWHFFYFFRGEILVGKRGESVLRLLALLRLSDYPKCRLNCFFVHFLKKIFGQSDIFLYFCRKNHLSTTIRKK